MLKLDGPLQLSPVFKSKIWGHADLTPLFAHPQKPDAQSGGSTSRSRAEPSGDDLIGEVWITDDASRFLNGPLTGLTLREASEQYGQELHGKTWKGKRFPILAKYIFTSDWLSVQVHPDDDYAALHDPGNVGKCEMWYIVRAHRDAKILLGLKPGVTRESLRAAFEQGASKPLLHAFRPKPDEAIYVPPGTVHALGPGLVLFEAEQNSDLTYRLDDFGRSGLDGKPRPLHLDKGMDVIRPDMPMHRDLPYLRLREPFGSRRLVVASRHFAVEEFRLRKTGLFQGAPGRVEVFSVLAGPGRVETEAGWFGFRTGDTWVIPPACVPYRLVPRREARLLKFYVPDLERDFRQPLRTHGKRATQIKKIIFD